MTVLALESATRFGTEGGVIRGLESYVAEGGADEFVGYRTFTNNTARLKTGWGNSAGVTYDAMSILCCFRILDRGRDSPMLYQDGTSVDLYFNNGIDAPSFYNGVADDRTASVSTNSDDWYIHGFTKTAAGQMRWHRYNFTTDTWTHVDSGVVGDGIAWPTSGPPDLNHWASNNGDWYFVGDAACMGVWTTNLSDGQVEALAAGLSNWSTVTPQHLWRYDSDPLTDLYGSANQVGHTGTTISTADSPLLL